MSKRNKSIWTDEVIRDIISAGEQACRDGDRQDRTHPFKILTPAGQRDLLNTYTKNGLSAVLMMLPLDASIKCLEQLIDDMQSRSIDDAVDKFVDHIAPRICSNSSRNGS